MKGWCFVSRGVGGGGKRADQQPDHQEPAESATQQDEGRKTQAFRLKRATLARGILLKRITHSAKP